MIVFKGQHCKISWTISGMYCIAISKQYNHDTGYLAASTAAGIVWPADRYLCDIDF